MTLSPISRTPTVTCLSFCFDCDVDEEIQINNNTGAKGGCGGADAQQRGGGSGRGTWVQTGITMAWGPMARSTVDTDSLGSYVGSFPCVHVIACGLLGIVWDSYAWDCLGNV